MSNLFDSNEASEDDVSNLLEEHREYLEKLAEMDVPASEDAQRALELLNQEDQS